MMVNNNLVGGIPTNPSEKSESVGTMAFPTEWKVIIQSCSKPPTSLSSIHGLFAIEIVDLPSYKMVIFHSFFVCLPEGTYSSIYVIHQPLHLSMFDIHQLMWMIFRDLGHRLRACQILAYVRCEPHPKSK